MGPIMSCLGERYKSLARRYLLPSGPRISQPDRASVFMNHLCPFGIAIPDHVLHKDVLQQNHYVLEVVS